MNPARSNNAGLAPDAAGRKPALRARADEPLARFDAAWAGYTASVDKKKLQFGCRPRRYRPPADVPRRGAVLALHGFSACGQQFYQLAPALAAQGFDVLVPMLPGHGLVKKADGSENLSAVPRARDWAASYGGLAETMNNIMRQSPGERVIIGYSLGGTLAINAAHRKPELYDRMLLIAPLVAIKGGAFVEGLANFLGRVPGIRNWNVKPAGLQADCAAWSEAGRAGFCDYRLEHIPALVQLERQNRDWRSSRPLSLPIQVILADEDVIVSNAAIEDLVQQQREFGPVSACTLTGGVPHEILTPYENVGREMVWLPEFLEMAGRFVIEGEAKDCGTGL